CARGTPTDLVPALLASLQRAFVGDAAPRADAVPGRRAPSQCSKLPAACTRRVLSRYPVPWPIATCVAPTQTTPMRAGACRSDASRDRVVRLRRALAGEGRLKSRLASLPQAPKRIAR